MKKGRSGSTGPEQQSDGVLISNIAVNIAIPYLRGRFQVSL